MGWVYQVRNSGKYITEAIKEMKIQNNYVLRKNGSLFASKNM